MKASSSSRASASRAAVCGKRCSSIVVEHVHYSTFYASFHARRGWARRGMTALMYPLADRVAAVSPGAARDLESRFPALRGRTAVLPSPGPDSVELRRLAGDVADHPWYSEVSGRPTIAKCGNPFATSTVTSAVSRPTGRSRTFAHRAHRGNPPAQPSERAMGPLAMTSATGH